MKYAEVKLPISQLSSSFRDGPPPHMSEFEGKTWYRAVKGVGILIFTQVIIYLTRTTASEWARYRCYQRPWRWRQIQHATWANRPQPPVILEQWTNYGASCGRLAFMARCQWPTSIFFWNVLLTRNFSLPAGIDLTICCSSGSSMVSSKFTLPQLDITYGPKISWAILMPIDSLVSGASVGVNIAIKSRQVFNCTKR